MTGPTVVIRCGSAYPDAVVERLASELADGGLPARIEDLTPGDDDVDTGIGHHGLRVVREHAGRELDVAFLGEIVDRDLRDDEPDAGPAGDQLAVLLDESHERGADIAAPQDPDPDIRHAPSVAHRHSLTIGLIRTD